MLVTAGSVDARAAAILTDGSAVAAAEQVRALAERHGMAATLQERCNTRATPQPKVASAPHNG
jgi:hypothetical protein